MKDNVKPIDYHPGIFDRYKEIPKLENWGRFSELMWGLGYEMDACESYDEYQSKSGLKLKEAGTEREKRRNTLYVLEHADRQVVGNFLFSQWRYYTHWSYGYDEYDVDFVRRIIKILEEKY